MVLDEFAERLAAALSTAGVPFMIAGSVASSYHGEPRTSMDVDFVIDPTREQLDRFIDSLGPEYYVSRSAAAEAYAQRRSFNVIDASKGGKADLIMCRPRPFSKVEFERRERLQDAEKDIWIASAEDTILAKLEWSRKGSSERQCRDALGIVMVMRDRLDLAYMRQWAEELGVTKLLNRILLEGGLMLSTESDAPPKE